MSKITGQYLRGSKDLDNLILMWISVAGVRTNVQGLLDYSLNEKKRNFLETVELQIGLKNYDPQREYVATCCKSVPRPNWAISLLQSLF